MSNPHEYEYILGTNNSDLADPTGFHIPIPSTATNSNDVTFIPTGSDLNLDVIKIRTKRQSTTDVIEQEYTLSYILYKARKHGGTWEGHKIIPANKFSSASNYNYTFTGIKNDNSPEICIDLIFSHPYNSGGYIPVNS